MLTEGKFRYNKAGNYPALLWNKAVPNSTFRPMVDIATLISEVGRQAPCLSLIHIYVHAFADEVKELGQALPRFTAHTWYRQPSEADRAKGQFDSEGLMDLSKLEGAFSDPTMQFYLCGPVGFMQFAAKQLVDLGVKQENIHYECFGPHKVL